MPVSDRALEVLGRLVAAISLGCLVAHVASAVLAPRLLVGMAPMLLLAAGCAYCATRLLRAGPGLGELGTATCFGVAMVALHLLGHHGGHADSAAHAHGSSAAAHGLMHLGVSLSVLLT